MPDLEILLQRLDPGLPVPSYAHAGDAGADLVTAIDVVLAPGERALVPRGTSRWSIRARASRRGWGCPS